MDIAFKNRKLEKIFNSEFELGRAYGKPRAKKIIMRLEVLRSVPNLGSVPTSPPERRHLLKGNRSGQFAVDVDKSHRLIFKPDHDSVITTEDGGIDVFQVTAIKIIEIIDYH